MIIYIPHYHIYSKGIIKQIDTELTIEEIMKHGKTPEGYEISHVRFNRKIVNDDGENNTMGSNFHNSSRV